MQLPLITKMTSWNPVPPADLSEMDCYRGCLRHQVIQAFTEEASTNEKPSGGCSDLLLPIPSGYPPTEEKKCMRTSPPHNGELERGTRLGPAQRGVFPAQCLSSTLPGDAQRAVCVFWVFPFWQGSRVHTLFARPVYFLNLSGSGGGEPLAVAPDALSWGHTILVCPPILFQLSLGPEQPGRLILWETLCSAF